MLQPEDLGGAVPGPVEDGLVWPLLPQPCGDTPVPQPVVNRTEAADLDTRFRVYENVAWYRGNRAFMYITELKAQLARCGVGGDEEGFDPSPRTTSGRTRCCSSGPTTRATATSATSLPPLATTW